MTTGDAGVVVTMGADVVELLLQMVDDVEALVADPGIAGAKVARRLVPEAHRDDPESEADYRSVVGPQLREERSAAAATMRAGLQAAQEGFLAADGDGGSRGDLMAEATARAERVGLGRDATPVNKIWQEAAPGSDVRRRAADEMARICERAVRVARKRGDLALAGELETLAASLGDGAASGTESRGGLVTVTLDAAEAEAWMITVNHARLAIGTACDVTEDMGARDPDDPRTPQLRVYDLLSALLEHLVDQVA